MDKNFKIFTSYFARIKHIHQQSPDIEFISISRFPPKFYTGLEYLPLAPSAELLTEVKHTNNIEHYTEVFNAYLNSLNPSSVISDLYEMSGGKNVCLVCYEKPGDFCHRHLVSKFLSPHLNSPISEYDEINEDNTTIALF